MHARIERLLDTALPELALRPASALRAALREGYGVRDLRRDILAGLTVGIVALPLSMALAIASGVPPQHGLYTAIVAGGAIALLGGSRVQVSGPTAAFVVVLLPISARFGIGGLLLATVMAGGILTVLGFARLGRLIQYVPFPVTTGFTAGIAIVIAVAQLKDLLGLDLPHPPEQFVERALAIARALPSAHPSDLAIGLVTLALLIVWPRITPRVPAPLVALTVAAVLAFLLTRGVLGFSVETIGSRFSYVADGASRPGIPAVPPRLVLPWQFPGPDGRPLGLSLDLLRALLPSAFAIAMLGAIESLLSAVVADGMTGTKHDPDAELIAQGTGNLLAPFFGGIAATGAIARTATNVRAGARSPIAALTHSAFLLAAVLAIAPLLAFLPMAALAALLLMVAWNMSELRHVRYVVRVAPRSDTLVLLTCLTLTVVFDMVVAVVAGIMLAALLFMRRMAELSGTTLVEGSHPHLTEPLPDGVVLYEVGGPLFFGAAEKAMAALNEIASRTRVVILDLSDVPAMDATGLVNLESTLRRLRASGVLVILSDVQLQPAGLLERAGVEPDGTHLTWAASLEDAVALARRHVTRREASPA
jgi:SulP family sulfate permease